MKKSLLVSMMACMATVGVQAQGYTEVGSMDNVPVLIPGSYTADGKPLLFVKGGGDIHDGTFHFYDSDLKPVRDIELGLPEKGSYTMVKARSAQIVLLHSDEFALSWWDGDYSPSDEWPTREDWIERLTSFLSGAGADSCVYVGEADTLWFVRNFYHVWENGSEAVYRDRPTNGYYLTPDNKAFRFYRNYEKRFSGAWREWKEEGYSSQDTPLGFKAYSDVSIGSEMVNGVLLTQAWFDEDDKFEYLYETWDYAPQEPMEYDRDNDGEVDSVRVQYTYLHSGVELRKEDGTKLWRYDYSEKTMGHAGDVYGYELSGKKYFAIYDRGKEAYVFFAVGKGGTSISEVREMPGLLRAYPNPAQRGETVTMELPEAGTEGAQRNVRITGMDGRTIQSVRVGVGERSVQVPLSRMSAGVYNFTLTENGRVVENSRIVVR